MATEQLISGSSDESTPPPLNFDLESKLQVASAALLMSKYSKRREFPLDDVTYNQGARRVIQYLHTLWLDQNTCDVTIVCLEGNVLTHQIILAAWSPTLASLFKQQNLDSDKSQDPLIINMNEYRRDVVADVINFLYTTDIRLTLALVSSIVAVSRELDLSTLVHVCSDFLIKTAEPQSILLSFSVAANNNLHEAREGLANVISSSLYEVSKHKHFGFLPYTRFLSLLTNHRVNENHKQIDIFFIINKWVDFKRKERVGFCGKLMRLLKFEEMTSDDLTHKVELASWMFSDKESKELLLRAFKIHAARGTSTSQFSNREVEKTPENEGLYSEKKKCLADSLDEFVKEYKQEGVTSTTRIDEAQWKQGSMKKQTLEDKLSVDEIGNKKENKSTSHLGAKKELTESFQKSFAAPKKTFSFIQNIHQNTNIQDDKVNLSQKHKINSIIPQSSSNPITYRAELGGIKDDLFSFRRVSNENSSLQENLKLLQINAKMQIDQAKVDSYLAQSIFKQPSI